MNVQPRKPPEGQPCSFSERRSRALVSMGAALGLVGLAAAFFFLLVTANIAASS